MINLVKKAYANGKQLTNPVTGIFGQPADDRGSIFATTFVSLWRSAMSIGALIVLVFYVIAAFEWITSGNDSQGVEKARQRFVNATIGLIILVSSFALTAFVGEIVFGDEFNIMQLTFPVDTGSADTDPQIQ